MKREAERRKSIPARIPELLCPRMPGGFEPGAGSEQTSAGAGPRSFAQSGFLSQHLLTVRDLKSGPIFSSWIKRVSYHVPSLSEKLGENSS